MKISSQHFYMIAEGAGIVDALVYGRRCRISVQSLAASWWGRWILLKNSGIRTLVRQVWENRKINEIVPFGLRRDSHLGARREFWIVMGTQPPDSVEISSEELLYSLFGRLYSGQTTGWLQWVALKSTLRWFQGNFERTKGWLQGNFEGTKEWFQWYFEGTKEWFQ